MSENDIQILKGELETLKAIFNEKWTSHDKRADERWSDLMDNIHEMGRKIDNRPCQAHGEAMAELASRMGNNERRIEGVYAKLWAVAAMVIGALITAVFGLFRHNG